MEASGGSAERREVERPPLSKGEAYAHDIDFPPGRGPGEPWWSFDSIAKRAVPQIRAAAAAAAGLTSEQLGSGGRFVIEAETMPNFLAASHFPDDIFRAASLIPVGSRISKGTRRLRKLEDEKDQPAKTYLLSATSDSLAQLEGIYETGGDLDDSIREDALKFTAFNFEGPDQVLKMGDGAVPAVIDDHFVFEAVLHPQLIDTGEADPLGGDRVRSDFATYIESLGGFVNLDYARFEADMWYLPVLLPRDPAAMRAAAGFAQLRVLRPMPHFRDLRPASTERDNIELLFTGSPATDRRIAIFDGGIDVQALGLSDWVTEHDLTDRARLTAHHEHGATVTSAALFGALDNAAHQPHTGIDHYRVWPMPAEVGNDIELPWVLDKIKEVVAQGAHKIVLITLAPALNAEDSDPHLWTATLDRLAFEHDVLFVVAAGNAGELEPDLDRVLVPADLINGISVGSCSTKHGLAIRDSYSCVGPGRPGAMTAPTGVQFGGNLDTTPFAALFPDGGIGGCEGTSYAAPVVARACAELDALLEGRATANLLRTMTVHQAARPSAKQAEEDGSTNREVGYGRFPDSFLKGFEHGPNELTISYDGVVKRRQLMAVEIPIPDDVFSAAPTKIFGICWTLGFFAPVEPANPVDYSAAGIHVAFRPHRRRYSFTNPKKEHVVDLDVEHPDNIAYVKYLEDVLDCTRSTYPVTAEQTGVATEVTQRHLHGKWEGVVRMDKGMRGKSLLGPRLDFHMLTREGGDLQRDADDLRYSLLVTIVAPDGVELYDRTVAEATLLTPLITSLPVLIGSGDLT
jgi:hypothetical protein